MVFFTTTSFLYSLSIFSFTLKLFSTFRTSMLIVLLIGIKRFITVLDPSSNFLYIRDNLRPE